MLRGVEGKRLLARSVVHRNSGLVAALFSVERQIVRGIDADRQNIAAALAAHIAHKAACRVNKKRLPADIIDRGGLAADSDGGIRELHTHAVHYAAAAAVDRHARRRSDDQMVAEQRKGVAAVVAERVHLHLALLILRDLIVGEKAAHTVKAAQVLPRRGDDHGQHDHKRQNHHQRPLELAAGAARGRLRAPQLLACSLFLFEIIH